MLENGAVFERTLILASAGSGKTFQLSSRLIGLLAAGAAPESILASTFTRKAAGEILDRVLLRLAKAALGEEDAAELRASLPAGIPSERTTREGFEALLVQVVRGLNRLQVLTLDAFIHRAVRAFALELGLPSAWQVGDEAAGARLRAEAIQTVLQDMDRSELLEIVRLLGLEKPGRRVHSALLEGVSRAHGLWRELDPHEAEPWGIEGGVPDGRRLPDGEWDALAAAVEAAGAGHPKCAAASAKIAGLLRRRDGAGAAGETLWVNVMNAAPGEEARFNRHPVPDALVSAIEGADRALRAHFRFLMQRRIEALGRLVPRYDEALDALRRARGSFDFDDLVALLRKAGMLESEKVAEFWYRLDGQLRHLLLDEFQDTSSAQWGAIAPLAEEMLASDEGDRALLVVADPKQSIYGWRGGEPLLLRRFEDDPSIRHRPLSQSYRSSRVILDFVNRVFRDPEGNPLLDGAKKDELRPIIADWAQAFQPHNAAKKDLPGYVRVVSGPAGSPGAAGLPPLLRLVALEVAELHRRAPGMTIGILTRGNAAANRVISELRKEGIEASGEGGVPVADSPAVQTVLALLSLVDHPGDRISAYLVASTPLGPHVGLPAGVRDAETLERVGSAIRARLIDEGYGALVAEWAAVLAPHVGARDRRRLEQLVDLAFGWTSSETLRPADFVERVRVARREDPTASPVRVMTIHRAKGLEFDAVFLPELGYGLAGREERAGVLPWRPRPGEPVARIFPTVPSALRGFFPEMADAVAAHVDARLRDGLSTLYVALTRARHALFIHLPPDGKNPSKAFSAANWIRHALEGGAEGFEPGELLEPDQEVAEWGDPGWAEAVAGMDRGERSEPPPMPELWVPAAPPEGRGPSPARPLVPAPERRTRLLLTRSPSGLEGGGHRALWELLKPRPTGALDRGTLVHRWMEEIEWLENGIPSRDTLLALAHSLSPGRSTPAEEEAIAALADTFVGWLELPAVRHSLSRGAWPEGTEVWRERRVAVVDSDALLSGTADRVMRLPDPVDDAPMLVVVDWKTDHFAAGDDEAFTARVEHYRPQMEAYLRALAAIEGVPLDRCAGSLVFLERGEAVAIPPGARGGR